LYRGPGLEDCRLFYWFHSGDKRFIPTVAAGFESTRSVLELPAADSDSSRSAQNMEARPNESKGRGGNAVG
jgi:hypothetical protein